MSPREQALSNVPEALTWVSAAINALNQVIGFNGKRSQIENLPRFKAVKTHFHVSLGPAPNALLRFLRVLPFLDDLGDPTLAALKEIRFRYFEISSKALSRPSNFVDSPAEGEGEDAPAFVPKDGDGTLRITPIYPTLGPLKQVLTLVHEGAHFIGWDFEDYAYRSRSDAESSDPRKYLDLPVQWALRNADSYAYFALQMAKGIDRVLVDE